MNYNNYVSGENLQGLVELTDRGCSPTHKGDGVNHFTTKKKNSFRPNDTGWVTDSPGRPNSPHNFEKLKVQRAR